MNEYNESSFGARTGNSIQGYGESRPWRSCHRLSSLARIEDGTKKKGTCPSPPFQVQRARKILCCDGCVCTIIITTSIPTYITNQSTVRIPVRYLFTNVINRSTGTTTSVWAQEPLSRGAPRRCVMNRCRTVRNTQSTCTISLRFWSCGTNCQLSKFLLQLS